MMLTLVIPSLSLFAPIYIELSAEIFKAALKFFTNFLVSY